MGLKQILGQAKFAQVGFVVNDIEETKKKYALLFDCAEPEADICGDYKVMQTKMYGEPAPLANCKLAFFDLTPGVSLELIEPNEYPSLWRDQFQCNAGGDRQSTRLNPSHSPATRLLPSH